MTPPVTPYKKSSSPGRKLPDLKTCRPTNTQICSKIGSHLKNQGRREGEHEPRGRETAGDDRGVAKAPVKKIVIPAVPIGQSKAQAPVRAY